MSKFKSVKERYNEVVSKIKEKDEGQTYDNSWKFSPTLPANKPKVNYVIRILPNVHVNEGLDEPWFEAYAHIYTRSTGKRVYTICPSTNGKDQKCPICEKARTYWTKVNGGSATKAEEDLARAYNRKARYYVNVLVVDDPRKGTEEDQTGKVLVWEVGPQIFEKFKDAFFDQKLPFFDPFEGFNFNLVIKKKGDFNNYESSHFSSAASSIGSEDDLDKIHGQIYNLQEKVAGRLRSYDELKKLLETPTGESEGSSEGAEQDTGATETSSEATPAPKAQAAPVAAAAAAKPKAATAAVEDEKEKEEDAGIDLDSLSDDELFK